MTDIDAIINPTAGGIGLAYRSGAAGLGGRALFLVPGPTTPITAPEVAPLEQSDEVFHEVNLLALRNTMLGNILDHCAVAMPNGRDQNSLPTSIPFSAPHGEDERLLSATLAIEQVVASAAIA